MPSAPEHVEVHPPPPHLRAWCLCAVVRRVRAGPVTARVQANTWACLNTIAHGEVHGAGTVLPRRFLVGPLAAPFETTVAGALASVSLVLQPWTLAALTGTTAGALGGRLVDVAQFAPGALAALCDASEAACESGKLEGLWSALAAHAGRLPPEPPALAWPTLAAEGVDAAASALGCSPRHYLRRFRAHMGMAPATWLRIRRWETAMEELAANAGSLAELSLRHGFSDQAHFGRETRSLVDETPARLRRLLHEGAGQWSLRPARVRFMQDAGDARS